MLAARLLEYGDPSSFRMAEVPAPSMGRGDLLVAVRAAGVNPIDAKIRAGSQRAVVRPHFPAVLGMDLAGDVVAVGEDVRGFAIGDAVFASPSHRRMGAYAEIASVDAREVAHKPKCLSYVEAASLPLAALTAWDALVRHGRLRAGQRVLVQAGAGGVGSLAIQIAKHLGAEVYATSSARNIELLRELGADHAIDYERDRYEVVAQGCDLVVDSLGMDHCRRALTAVRRGGRIIALTTGMPEAVARHGPWLGLLSVAAGLLGFATRARLTKNVAFRPIARKCDGEALAHIGALVEKGALRPLIEAVLPFAEVGEAHRRIEEGRSRGKLVLTMGRES
jgi:NADPH:quinone reductase-like Zn-dependent oxidoreductase